MVEIYNALEQGEVVKKWLQENGSAIVMGLVIAFGGLFGFKQWQAWELNTKQLAYAEFEIMNQLLTDGQLDGAMANYQTLQDKHEGSAYATMAALQMGKARMEANQDDLAIKHFRFVVDQGYPKALRVIARERLARMLLSQEKTTEALEVIQGEAEIDGFESRFAETRGDIYLAMGQSEDAISSYQEALDTLETGVGDRATLVLKLESLGVVQDDEVSSS